MPLYSVWNFTGQLSKPRSTPHGGWIKLREHPRTSVLRSQLVCTKLNQHSPNLLAQRSNTIELLDILRRELLRRCERTLKVGLDARGGDGFGQGDDALRDKVAEENIRRL